MVLTATGDTTARAKVVAKYLTEFGRTDIPIGIGVVSDRPDGTLFPWGADYDLEKYPGTVHQDGVGAAIQLIKAAAAKGEHIQIIAIAPCNNFPPLLTAYPDIVESVSVSHVSPSIPITCTSGEGHEWLSVSGLWQQYNSLQRIQCCMRP